MASFDSGVTGYVQGRAIVTQFWPIDRSGNAQISCAQCFYYREASRRCGITGEVSAFPNKFVGSNCPMMDDDNFNTLIKEMSKDDQEV